MSYEVRCRDFICSVPEPTNKRQEENLKEEGKADFSWKAQNMISIEIVVRSGKVCYASMISYIPGTMHASCKKTEPNLFLAPLKYSSYLRARKPFPLVI